jgi:3-methyladenine DNA glycosylase AlkD
VDLSASHILGDYLKDKNRRILYELAKVDNLWRNRIAMISTQAFIRNDDLTETLKLAEHFVGHPHDLMHKAVGWMLREVGSRNLMVERDFLDRFYKIMPRTMLRYAIEKFPEKLRKKYLEGKIQQK